MNFSLKQVARAPRRHRSQSMVRLAACCETLEGRRLLLTGMQSMGGAAGLPSFGSGRWESRWAEIAQMRGSTNVESQDVNNLGSSGGAGPIAVSAVAGSPMGLSLSQGGPQTPTVTTSTDGTGNLPFSPFNAGPVTNSSTAIPSPSGGASGSQAAVTTGSSTATSGAPAGISVSQGAVTMESGTMMPSFPGGISASQGGISTGSSTATPSVAGGFFVSQGTTTSGSSTAMPNLPVGLFASQAVGASSPSSTTPSLPGSQGELLIRSGTALPVFAVRKR